MKLEDKTAPKAVSTVQIIVWFVGEEWRAGGRLVVSPFCFFPFFLKGWTFAQWYGKSVLMMLWSQILITAFYFISPVTVLFSFSFLISTRIALFSLEVSYSWFADLTKGVVPILMGTTILVQEDRVLVFLLCCCVLQSYMRWGTFYTTLSWTLTNRESLDFFHFRFFISGSLCQALHKLWWVLSVCCVLEC